MTVPPSENIRLLLIDDHTLFRDSLARLLEAEPGFEVTAHCSSGNDALQIMRSQAVDLILLDLDLGSESGVTLLTNLRNANFEGKVLIVTAGVNDRDVPGLIRNGISGILMKHKPPALLVQGIRDAMNGKVLFDQDLLRRAVALSEASASGPPNPALTPREKQVLSSVFEGLTNKEIATRLKVSESAIKSCLQQLFAKTGVRTRSQLVRVALEQYRDEL